MALIECPECGKEISDKSNVCMNCGVKIKKRKKSKVIIPILIILIGIVVIFAITTFASSIFKSENQKVW